MKNLKNNYSKIMFVNNAMLSKTSDYILSSIAHLHFFVPVLKCLQIVLYMYMVSQELERI